MIYVAVMVGTQGKGYRTPCRSVKEAEWLVANYEGLGFMGWIELEETEE